MSLVLFTDYSGTRLILVLILVNISRFPKHGDNNALLGVCSRLSWGMYNVKVLEGVPGFLEGVPGCSGFSRKCSGVFRFFTLFRVFQGVPVFRCSWNYYMPNGTSEKVVLFFRTECSKRKFLYHLFKPNL